MSHLSHVTFTPPQVYHSNGWCSWDYGNPACSPSNIGSSSSVEVSALKISFSSIVQYFVAKIEQTRQHSKNFLFFLSFVAFQGSGQTGKFYNGNATDRQEGIQRQTLCENRNRQQHQVKLSAIRVKETKWQGRIAHHHTDATVPHIVALLGSTFHAAKIRTFSEYSNFWS